MTKIQKFNKFKGVETLDQVDIDDDITVTTSDITVFSVDCRRIKDSIITFYNNGATDIIYKVFGSSNGVDTLPLDGDNSWFNLLNVLDVVTPSSYDHAKSQSIPPSTPWYESFGNKWSWIRVTASVAVGTEPLRIYMRSSN